MTGQINLILLEHLRSQEVDAVSVFLVVTYAVRLSKECSNQYYECQAERHPEYIDRSIAFIPRKES